MDFKVAELKILKSHKAARSSHHKLAEPFQWDTTTHIHDLSKIK